MGKRLGALAAAVLMILLAVFVRSKLDDDGDGSGSGNGDGDGELTIACVPELAAACNSIDDVTVIVQDPTAPPADVDGWVTLDPFPAILQIDASKAMRLASTPLVIAMVHERGFALASRCGGTVTWKCLIDVAGRPWADVGGQATWGMVRVGLPPRSSAMGLLLTAEAVASYVGRSNYFVNDFDDGFGPWFTQLRNAATVNDPLTPFVQQFPAAFSAVGTTQADVTSGLGRVQDQTNVITPEPVVRAVAIYVPMPGGESSSDLTERLRDALDVAGWEVPPQPSNLPDPGVLINLRDR